MKCDWCSIVKADEAFELHVHRGVERRKNTCIVCVPAKKKYMADWWKSNKGKECVKKNNARPEKIEGAKVYRKSAKGRATIKKNSQKEINVTKRREYQQSDTYKKQRSVKSTRITADEGLRLQRNMAKRLSRFLSGYRSKPRKFVVNSSFKNLKAVMYHFKSLLPDGVTMEDYGKKWEVEHKIPMWCYNHKNMDDVKRCWSLANLHIMKPSENQEKGWAIHDEFVKDVDPMFRPLLFESEIPTEHQKCARYACVRGGQGVF
eukprot:954741-Prymnesium_polylepis.1